MVSNFKHTKIIASIGPASDGAAMVESLVAAGVNGVRLNFSHGDHAEHARRIKWTRAASKKVGKPVAVILDLQGPKMRLGELPRDGIEITAGQQISLAHRADFAKTGHIPLQYDLSGAVRPGETIFMVDGRLRVEVERVRGGVIYAQVVAGGHLSSRKGINLPDTDLAGNILTTKDYTDIGFAMNHDIDYIALSFVQTAGDIGQLRKFLAQHNSDIKIIAKIETKAAAHNLEDIIMASDGVMVARGDLAIEAGPETVPILQRQIIGLARRHGKIAIVATQMLASMTDSLQPTRAEVADIAAAVICGADCLMLSDETAVGNYPLESVQLMKRVSLYAERNSPVEPLYTIDTSDHSQATSLASAAIALAHQVQAKAIVVETATGRSAHTVAALRPDLPIIMVTTNSRVAQQLAIVYGGKSNYFKSARGAGNKIIEQLLQAEMLAKGDSVVLTYGQHPGISGGTDTIKVMTV